MRASSCAPWEKAPVRGEEDGMAPLFPKDGGRMGVGCGVWGGTAVRPSLGNARPGPHSMLWVLYCRNNGTECPHLTGLV